MHATKKCLVRPTIHVVQYPSESSESKCCAEEEEVAEEMLFKTTGIDIAQKNIERDGRPQITRYPASIALPIALPTPQTTYLWQIYYLHFITHNITR